MDASSPTGPRVVVLLEFADEVDPFLAYCAAAGRPPASHAVVALSPAVQAALKRGGVPFENTLPFFGNDAHRRIVLTSEEWLRHVEQTAPIVDSDGLSETYTRELSYRLRFYVAYFLRAVEILDAVCRTRPVKALAAVVPGVPQEPPSDPEIRRERYLGSVVREYAAAHRMEFAAISAAPPVAARSARGNLRRALGRLADSPLAWLDRQKIRRIGSKPTVVITTLSYNMRPLVARVRRMCPDAAVVLLETGVAATLPRLRHWRGDPEMDAVLTAAGAPVRGDGRLEEGLARIEHLLDADWAGAFVSSGVSFTAVFGAKIRVGLVPWLRAIRFSARSIREILRTLRPRLVVSPFASGPVAAVGEICGQIGVPGLMVPHGMLTPPRSEVEAIESYRLGTGFVLTTFEHTALQSPWSERYVDAFTDRPRPSAIRTGSLILSSRRPDRRDHARRGLFGPIGAGAKVLVYATTLKSRASLRMHTHETLDEHLAGIADMVQAVRDTPNVYLLVKLHPAGVLTEGQVRELVEGIEHERVAVATTLPFVEALSAADVLVSYSSTCIEEAIQAGVPVLLYDRWARYEHLPSASLDDGPPAGPMPVYYVSNPHRLKDAVRWITERHVQADIPASEIARHVYPPEVSPNFERFVRQCIDGIPAHAS